MNKKDWIKRNRSKIDEITQSPYKNDEERALWIDNNEYLYNACRANIDL